MKTILISVSGIIFYKYGKICPRKQSSLSGQKDWILLARGYYNRSLETRRLSHFVSNTSDKGTAIFPLSIAHVEETLRNLNPKRRKRLASFMIKVSKGYSILPSNSIMESEVRQAALKKLGLPTVDVKKIAIGRGISHMLGAKGELIRKEEAVGPDLPEETKKKILDYVDSPQALLRFLTSRSLAEKTQDMRQIQAAQVEKMEEIRRQHAKIVDNDLRFRVSIVEFLIGIVGPWLTKLAVELNLPMNAIISKDWTQQEFTQFFQTMPTAYCLFTLTYRRDQYLQRAFDKNDINDIWALTMAIPYCDIVVTESMWASIAQQSKLDRIYETLILSSIEQLDGCI